MRMFGTRFFRAAACAALGSVALTALPSPVFAQIFLRPPSMRPGPIEASDPLVGIPIPGATPAEYRAHLLWNIRAGLNVSALQCQFSPYLRSVANYNALIAHHSGELATAYTTLTNYFKRVHGAKGQKLFDDYSTSTYNNWSTFQGQYGFCQTAADISRQALLTPKGEFHLLAQRRMRELRNSLLPSGEPAIAYNPYELQRGPVLPSFQENCWKKDRLLRRCGGLA